MIMCMINAHLYNSFINIVKGVINQQIGSDERMMEMKEEGRNDKNRKTFEEISIVTWNVAGWRATSDKILKRHGSLDKWLQTLDADILCLQEVKLSKEYIRDQPKECGAMNKVGFDSFWSYPGEGSAQGLGLNGVATFARKGLTMSATNNVFDDAIDGADLNREGRAVMTDHGTFVLFNVYVPFSGTNYSRFGFKLRLQTALQRAMSRQRDLGKRVILVGDLNTSSSIYDCQPSFCKINFSELINIDFGNYSSCRALCERLQILISSSRGCLTPEGQAAALGQLVELVDIVKTKWPDIHKLLSTRAIESSDTLTGPYSALFQFGDPSQSPDLLNSTVATSKSYFKVVSYLPSGRGQLQLGRASQGSKPLYDFAVETIQADCDRQELVVDGSLRLAMKNDNNNSNNCNNSSNSSGSGGSSGGGIGNNKINNKGGSSNSNSNSNSNNSISADSSTLHTVRSCNTLYMHEFLEIWRKLYGIKTVEQSSIIANSSSYSCSGGSGNSMNLGVGVGVGFDREDKLGSETIFTTLRDLFDKHQHQHQHHANAQPSLSYDHLSLLMQLFGRPSHQELTVSWLNGLISDGNGMIDTTRAFFSNLGNKSNKGVDKLSSDEKHSSPLDIDYSNKNSNSNKGSSNSNSDANSSLADYRFTCWDQQHNCRLTNEGTRIDYILVDRDLVVHESNSSNSCRSSCSSSSSSDMDYNASSDSNCNSKNSGSSNSANKRDDDNSSNNESNGASCGGGPSNNNISGCSDPNRLRYIFRHADASRCRDALVDAIAHSKGDAGTNDYLTAWKTSSLSQSTPCSAGLIYTPAELSDHIAVYLRMKLPSGVGVGVALGSKDSGGCSVGFGSLALSTDKATKATQPHNQQAKLSFGVVRTTAGEGGKEGKAAINSAGLTSNNSIAISSSSNRSKSSDNISKISENISKSSDNIISAHANGASNPSIKPTTHASAPAPLLIHTDNLISDPAGGAKRKKQSVDLNFFAVKKPAIPPPNP